MRTPGYEYWNRKQKDLKICKSVVDVIWHSVVVPMLYWRPVCLPTAVRQKNCYPRSQNSQRLWWNVISLTLWSLIAACFRVLY